jgi:hypothetical protein
MREITVLAKLLAIREGTYTMYVFKNLENGEYLMCTRVPNWNSPEVSIGEEGFLKIEIVKAGEEYYNPATGVSTKYLYSNVYFKNFILKSDIINSEIIL